VCGAGAQDRLPAARNAPGQDLGSARLQGDRPWQFVQRSAPGLDRDVSARLAERVNSEPGPTVFGLTPGNPAGKPRLP